MSFVEGVDYISDRVSASVSEVTWQVRMSIILVSLLNCKEQNSPMYGVKRPSMEHRRFCETWGGWVP